MFAYFVSFIFAHFYDNYKSNIIYGHVSQVGKCMQQNKLIRYEVSPPLIFSELKYGTMLALVAAKLVCVSDESRKMWSWKQTRSTAFPPQRWFSAH